MSRFSTSRCPATLDLTVQRKGAVERDGGKCQNDHVVVAVYLVERGNRGHREPGVAVVANHVDSAGGGRASSVARMHVVGLVVAHRCHAVRVHNPGGMLGGRGEEKAEEERGRCCRGRHG